MDWKKHRKMTQSKRACHHVDDPEEVPAQPVQAPATAAIWGVRQWMETPFPYLSLSLSNKQIHLFLKK